MPNSLFTYIILGVLLLLVILVVILLFSRNNKKDDSSFKEFLDRELEKTKNEQRLTNNQILQAIVEIKASMSKELTGFNSNINKDFLTLSDRTVNKLTQLEERINKNIKDNQKESIDTFTNIQERLTKIDAAQKNIDALSKDINSLQNILNDKKNRGTFGEIELYSLLESAYGIDESRWQKQYHFETKEIADAVVFGGESLGIICIDSKFPLENYRRMYSEELPKEDREKAKNMFKADVKKHIDDISRKYIIPGVTSEFAYMFIPAEAIFADIYGYFQDICDYSYKSKVYMVSPTTLMAYITAIKSIYLGQQREEKAKDILRELSMLAEDFRRFDERRDKMLKSINSLESTYDEFNTSCEKISRKFDKINSGDLDE